MLPDIMQTNLDIVFVGTAKSVMSVSVGHYYGNPMNHFWKLLHAARFTESLLTAADDATLPSFGIGLTDLVSERAASSDALLVRDDFDPGGFVDRMLRWEPEVVAFNGKNSASYVARFLKQPRPEYGPQSWAIGSSLVYVLPASSSANARGGYDAKAQQWRQCKLWCDKGSSEKLRRTNF